MPKIPGGALPPAPAEFGLVEWQEEVERYDRNSPARIQAQRARENRSWPGAAHLAAL